VDEAPQGLLSAGEIASLEHPIHRFAPQEFRGDRRVRANSEETMILGRRHRGEQLTLTGQQGSGPSHDLLSESEQMLGTRRVVGEQPAEIGLAVRLWR
jgi:hypothetical protein